MNYIWIPRWRDFQHYKPDPERGPAWIKTHTAQLNDDRYLDLTDRQRALIHDLRMMFATFRGRLRHDAPMIARHRNTQTRHADLVSLNQAGLIEVISRETLEQRLDQLYSRSRAEVEKRREEPPKPQPVVPTTPPPDLNGLSTLGAEPARILAAAARQRALEDEPL